MCSVLQCVAVCCSALQCVARSRGQECQSFHPPSLWSRTDQNDQCSVVQLVAVCCSVLQCVAVCCSVLQCAVLQHVAVYAARGNVLHCVAVCCNLLQLVVEEVLQSECARASLRKKDRGRQHNPASEKATASEGARGGGNLSVCGGGDGRESKRERAGEHGKRQREDGGGREGGGRDIIAREIICKHTNFENTTKIFLHYCNQCATATKN